MTDSVAAAGNAAASQFGVSGALRAAANVTGVDFDYLYRVAVRESALNPQAKAKTSSAAGLFQFIEQTWLETVKRYGERHGLADEAASIRETAAGKFVVEDADLRKQILDMRFDTRVASALAGELANENRATLEGRLGRMIDSAELYAAHFLGAGGATTLLSAQTGDVAATLLPDAARANRHVFYDGARARTVGEVLGSIRNTIGGEGAPSQAVTVAAAHIDAPRPALRDRPLAELPNFGRRSVPSSTGDAIAALSPLAIAVLQALDPTRLRDDDRDS